MEHSDFIAVRIGDLEESKTVQTALDLAERSNEFDALKEQLVQKKITIHNLYPNPLSKGPFQLDIYVPERTQLTLNLFNVEGKSLEKFTQTFEKGNQLWMVQPNVDLPSGVIFYHLTDSKHQLYGKIQISK
jgi:hypothetical protein